LIVTFFVGFPSPFAGAKEPIFCATGRDSAERLPMMPYWYGCWLRKSRPWPGAGAGLVTTKNCDPAVPAGSWPPFAHATEPTW
jgi:hypothetical protein